MASITVQNLNSFENNLKALIDLTFDEVIAINGGIKCGSSEYKYIGKLEKSSNPFVAAIGNTLSYGCDKLAGK